MFLDLPHRGYLVGFERNNGRLLVSVFPKTPDLPILRRYSFESAGQSEGEALAEAKTPRGSTVCQLHKGPEGVFLNQPEAAGVC